MKSRAKRTVLVVDDDQDCIASLTSALDDDYHVLAAENGDEGLRVARTSAPAVIILDVVMPGNKDGFATFCELKQDKRTCHIPVLMLTQVNELTELEFSAREMSQYLGDSPTAFLEKPVSTRRLRKAVDRAVADGK